MTFQADAAIAACDIRFPGSIFTSGDGRCKTQVGADQNNKHQNFFTQDLCTVSVVEYCYYTIKDANATFNS